MNSIIKWELFIRFKRRYLESSLLKGLNHKVITKVFLVVNFIKLIVSYITFDIFFNNNAEFGVIQNELKSILDLNHFKSLVIVIMIIYIFIDINYTALDAIRMKNNFSKMEWYLANTDNSFIKINSMILISEILWSMGNFIIVQLPFLLVFSQSVGYSLMGSIFICIDFIFINMILKFTLSILYDLIIYGRKSNALNLIGSVFIKIIIFIFCYKIGKIISPWIIQFPLIRKEVDINIFMDWINQPYNHLNKYMTSLNYPYIVNSILTSSIPLVFLCIILLITYKYIYRKSISRIKVNKPVHYLQLNSAWKYYVVYSFRMVYKNKTIANVLGSNWYWAAIFLLTSILQSVESGSKMYHLLIFSSIFIPAFFLSEDLITKLSKTYLFAGEGKKLFLWITNDYKELFLYKIRLFISNIIPIYFFGGLIMLFSNNIMNKHVLFIVTLQILYSILYFLLKNMAYLKNSGDISENDQEFKKSLDGKFINDSIGLLFLGILLPVTSIPVALYLTNDIGFKVFYLIQFHIQGLIVFTACILCYFILHIKLKDTDLLKKLWGE